ncbi:MAG TPA: cupin domain-containing protein, partial [Anaerolineae bacterium]|nr:cupin domain-containing protein [Anaerolineae bacterium]
DVIDGQGVFVVDSIDFPGPAGKCVFVKAGTSHAMRNDSDQPWTVRVTYQQRLYARHVGLLVGRAIRKRLELAQ